MRDCTPLPIKSDCQTVSRYQNPAQSANDETNGGFCVHGQCGAPTSRKLKAHHEMHAFGNTIEGTPPPNLPRSGSNAEYIENEKGTTQLLRAQESRGEVRGRREQRNYCGHRKAREVYKKIENKYIYIYIYIYIQSHASLGQGRPFM